MALNNSKKQKQHTTRGPHIRLGSCPPSILTFIPLCLLLFPPPNTDSHAVISSSILPLIRPSISSAYVSRLCTCQESGFNSIYNIITPGVISIWKWRKGTIYKTPMRSMQMKPDRKTIKNIIYNLWVYL